VLRKFVIQLYLLRIRLIVSIIFLVCLILLTINVILPGLLDDME